MNSNDAPSPATVAWSEQDVNAYLNQPMMDGQRPLAGTEGMTIQQIEDDILRGGRFRVFLWNFSIVVMSFQRSSALRYYRSNQSCGAAAWGWTLLSSVIGWWGIPWGIFFTLQTIYTNCMGGKDMTGDILAAFVGQQRANSVMSKAQKPSMDILLWLLRILVLAGVMNIAVIIYLAINSGH